MNSKAFAALLVPAVAASAWWLTPAFTPAKPQAATNVPAVKPLTSNVQAAVQAEIATMDLALALEQKSVEVQCQGNGRDRLVMRLLNKGDRAMRVSVPLGQTFENESGAAMVVVQQGDVTVQPGKRAELRLQAVGLKSTNPDANSLFRFSFATVPKLDPLLILIQKQKELSSGAVQTAVLALTENLPLSAVAKFPLAASVVPSRFNTDAFRVETVDIVKALALLRQIGVREDSLTLTIDPQLKIEAMIDPTARPVAMNYYGITPEAEWDFWRNELLKGEPTTRHYALYGIARFYPDVALQMLPRWARETRTNPVYRLAAVQALADTQLPEALVILRQLQPELGLQTELGKAAGVAAEYLEYQLAQLANAQKGVAFLTEQNGGNQATVVR